jgi:glycosyltransferase involved in cell wall biosynthesis
VTLLCADPESDRSHSQLTALGVEVQKVNWRRHVPAGRWGLINEALRGPGSEQFRTVMPGVRAMADALAIAQEQREYDVAFIWGAELAPLLDVAQLPTAYYVTDANTTYLRRQVRAAPTLRHRLLFTLDAAHVRRWERTRYRRATGLATTSQSEAEVLERLTGRSFDIIPVALGDEWFAAADVSRERNLVTIVAGLDYAPNVDGIRWFVDESWPRIKSELPEARLRVVGRSPSSVLRASLHGAGVELFADVPDARPHYWQATVAVIPLRVGSGVKNKLIHAFACGAPVVGTSVATEGTATVHRTHALMADDPGAFADAVIETLRHPAEAALRAQSARGLAEPYRTEHAAEALELFWQKTCAGRAEPAPGSGVDLAKDLDVRSGTVAPRERP